MNRRAALILGGVLVAVVVFNVLFRYGSMQGFTSHSEYPATPGSLPECVDARNIVARGGPGYQLTRLDVSLTACNDPAGNLRVVSGPTCSAWSAFGPGTAICSSAQAENGLKVTVNGSFPFLIAGLTDQPSTETLVLSPSGSVSMTYGQR